MPRAALLLVVFLSGCQWASPGLSYRGSMAPEDEALAGTRAAPALEARHGGLHRNRGAERRMDRVGRRLCRRTFGNDGRYRYRLLDTDEVDAFSLPGGRIYITRALYARLVTDHLLAAVLAHEMAHLAARDHFKPRSRHGHEALDRELAADAEAIAYLRAAGISPVAMLEVIQILEDSGPGDWPRRKAQAIDRAREGGGLPTPRAPPYP